MIGLKWLEDGIEQEVIDDSDAGYAAPGYAYQVKSQSQNKIYRVRDWMTEEIIESFCQYVTKELLKNDGFILTQEQKIIISKWWNNE